MSTTLRTSTAIAAVLALSACGGGTATPGMTGGPGGGLPVSTKSVTTVNATGSATAVTDIAAPSSTETFSGTVTSLSEQDNGGTFGVDLVRRDVSVAATTDPNVLDITYGGQTFRAVSVNNGMSFSAESGGKSIFFNPTVTRANVVAGVLTYGDGTGVILWGDGEIANLAHGYATDPATVAARSATASYTGSSRVQLASTTQGLATGAGQVDLTADFTNNTVQGNLTLTYTEPLQVASNPLDITLNPSTISGNSFGGTLGLTPSQFGATSTTNATYTGSFFGPTAGEVGGTFSVEGSGLIKDTVIQGSFSGIEN